MPVIYKVTIKTAKKQNQFHITWKNMETSTESPLDQSVGEITRDEIKMLWHHPRNQLTIGNKLFRFLDGDNHYLERALDNAGRQGESLILHLDTCKETTDWPFELLAQDNRFLLPQRLHLVRCV